MRPARRAIAARRFARAAGAGVLHLAAHGRLRTDNPLRDTHVAIYSLHASSATQLERARSALRRPGARPQPPRRSPPLSIIHCACSQSSVSCSARASVIASRLAPGGYLHCATDWEEYAQQMLEVLSAEPLLANTAEGYAPKPDYRPLTKFENRGIKLGHGVWDLVFRRV